MEVGNKFAHHAFLQRIADADVQHVLKKDTSYGASWKQRGGVGAFMMLARKMDRLNEMMERPPGESVQAAGFENGIWSTKYPRYDVFAAVEYAPSGDDGTVLAEIRDLRHYLLLVEAEMCARGVVDVKSRAPCSIQELFDPPKINIDGPPSEIMKREMHAHELTEQLVAARPAPVPLEDSNKHADRVVTRDGMLHVGEHWVQFMDADVFLENRRHFSDEVRSMYVRVGEYFVLDRRMFPAEERAERFLALPLTVASDLDKKKLPVWAVAMYEPRTNVAGELQLISEYREAWGA